MGSLSFLTGWRGYAAAALAAGLVLGGLAWTVQGWRLGLDLAAERASHARVMEERANAALAAVEAARTEERRRIAALEDARNDALEKAAAAADDAATAHAAGQRLRARIDALVADATRRDPGITAGGASKQGRDPLNMLAELLNRHSAELVEVGRYADRLRISALACEASYDGLGR